VGIKPEGCEARRIACARVRTVGVIERTVGEVEGEQEL
jgi:hypothetical protein